MADFTFVTTNEHKVQVAKIICEQFGVTFERKNLELTEIQHDDGAVIAGNKVQQAYRECGGPVVVSDSTWLIMGLNGFPGPYMKQMNQKLTTDDFLTLTRPLSDRRIIYRQILAYKNDEQEKTFSADIEGLILKEPRGTSIYTSFPIISLDGGKHSLAEADEKGQPSSAAQHNAWHDLCEWLRR